MLSPSTVRLFNHVIVALLGICLCYLSFLIASDGYYVIGLGTLLVTVLFTLTYIWSKAYTWRYLFPGLLGFGMFVIFPLTFTVYISFTNFSSLNLLRYEQVLRYFKTETFLAADTKYPFSLYPAADGQYRVLLRESDSELFLSPEFNLGAEPVTLEMERVDSAPATEPLALRDIIKLRKELQKLTLALPDGSTLSNTGLRDFGPREPLYDFDPERDQFTNRLTGAVLGANHETGRFEVVGPDGAPNLGEAVGPGFRTWIGLDNYLKILTDKGIQGPFIKIFVWTVLFSLGSVFFSLCVGMFLAVLLQWKELHYRKLYRTLLILPYAVPAFISILIFRGLFNQNFGEINMMLDALFGIKPEWFADPVLAKVMILIVNTWLGYPYMMIVCTGILQSVPDTIYEASALDGSNPIADFFFLTLPLIFKPLFPLLVASFAFNFNNFLIIYLLTGGGPDMVGASTVAGETDILVSYTFRIAFRDSAQNFGYASAIAAIIFVIVALIAWWNLRLTEEKH